MPIGIGYVSASLKRAGHEVTILNPNHSLEELPWLIEQAVRTVSPQVVGTGGMAFHLNEIRQITSIARSLLPQSVIMIGGAGVTYLPETVMTAIPEADFGVIGEGELTSVQLMSALETGSDISSVKGLIYRTAKSGPLKRTAPRPLEENLDTLPWVDYEGLGLDIYASLHLPGECAPALIADSRTRVMPFITSCGCPFSCTFCCHQDAAGHRYRTRSMDDVFAEIRAAIGRFKINALLLYEDLFCLQRERLEEFCTRIKPLGLRWICSLRVEQIDEEMLQLMRESGCCCISLGVESMSPAILASMRKQNSREDIERALSLIYDAKIAVSSNLLFGDPAETMETVQESLEWFCNNGRYNMRLAMIGYHPGSKIYDDAVKRGLIGDPISYLLSGNPEINATDLPDDIYKTIPEMMNRAAYTFGHAGRLVELKQTGRHNYLARCICPHCGAVGECNRIEDHPGITRSINCPDCNRAYRVPVIIRNSPPPETSRHIDTLLSIEPRSENEKAILDCCADILALDPQNSQAYTALIALADNMGDNWKAIELLQNSIEIDPYNPALFAQMAHRLAKAGVFTQREKYLQKATHLYSAGINGSTCIYVAPQAGQ